MGQYYVLVFLNEKKMKGKNHNVYAFLYASFLKLAEMSYIHAPASMYTSRVLSDKLAGCSVACSGDYDEGVMLEVEGGQTNYFDFCGGLGRSESDVASIYDEATDSYVPYRIDDLNHQSFKYERYIVNHTKKEYVDMTLDYNETYPLFGLVQSTTGAGGGDRLDIEFDCGEWAFDEISTTNDKDQIVGYKQILELVEN